MATGVIPPFAAVRTLSPGSNPNISPE